MKNYLLLSIFTCLTLTALTQNQALVKSQVKNSLVQASNNSLENLTKPSRDLDGVPKTLLCLDTVRYPQLKEQLLNATATFNIFTLWTADQEWMSQTYLNSGGTITIPKVEFFGKRNTAGSATVTVQGSIYNVNASNVPTTLISSGTVTVTSTTAGYYQITLSTPAVVTGNYAVVIRPTTTNGQLDLYVNNILAGQTQDENLSRVRSTYYPQSAGNWVSVPVMTNDPVNFAAIYDFEGLISPIISYTITTAASVLTSPSCLGTPVQFINNTTPTGIINNRMYNYERFNLYFGLAASDSTYAWNMGNASPIIWSTATTYTYPVAGTYNAALFTLGGLWASCLDFASVQVIINPIGNSNFNYSAGSYCVGSSNPTPTINQAGTFSATPSGLNFQSTSTGQINLAASAPNIYTVSFTTSGPCPSTSTQTVTITTSSNSSFAYSGNTFCSGSSNQTPTVFDTGTFSSMPAGLVFVSTATGEINMMSSANNTYTIAHSVTGACASSSQQTVTITSAPTGGFSYAQAAFCSNDLDQAPVFNPGASAGVFSSSPAGLIINGSGQITTASSAAGTYLITNTITGGGCPTVSETASVTINTAPSVSLSPQASVCITDNAFQLTGGSPSMGTYSGLGVSNGMFSPATVMAGVHSIYYTYTNINNCSSSAVQPITVGAIPTVTMAPFANSLCVDAATIPCPSGTPVGGIYSGIGVSGSTFSPSLSGAGSYEVTYTYTSAEGCEASAMQSVIVNALPNVALSALNGVCSSDVPFALSGGSPTGGSYSGPGVEAGGMFVPSIAGVGTHSITYSYTSSSGCLGTASQSIVVDDCSSSSISEISGVSALIFPNPAKGLLNIIINNGNVETLSISLISTDGKEVLKQVSSQQNINIQINVSSFAAGVYYVSVNSELGKIIRKVVIQ